MDGSVHHLPGGTLLDDSAEVHDGNPICQHHRTGQIMGDDQNSEAVAAKIINEFEHAGTHRNVEHRNRLIGHQQPGRQRDRGSDGHPLTLPPRKLMRKAVQHRGRRGQTNSLKCLAHDRCAVTARHPVDTQTLLDDRTNGKPGVECVVGILMHQLDGPAIGPQFRAPQTGDVDTVENHPAAAGVLQADDRAGHCALAATGLAHQSHNLTGLHRQRQTLDGMHHRLP